MKKLTKLSEKDIEDIVSTFTEKCPVCGNTELTVKASAIITVIYEYSCRKCNYEWIEDAGY